MQLARNFNERTRTLYLAAIVSAVALLLPAPAWSQCDTTVNGTFKFLTQALPEGTTNAEYVARVLSANADGPVTFSVDTLPSGLSLDPASGFITGRPTSSGNTNATFTADDTTQQVTLPVTLKISSSGGGGNGGSTFTNASLADGRVGTAYSETLGITDGVGPYIYGAANLPSGLSLDGQTGEIAGSPSSPGTFFPTLSVTDFGDDNKGVTVLPLTVLPLLSDFELLTQMLNNGEVGTAFCDAWLTQGETGVVSFSSTALPDGLVLDPLTGEVSGTPTAPGTFDVIISAFDGIDTISSNLSMVIVPSSTSPFYWDFFGLPAALLDVVYDRQPPILLASQNGSSVEYTAVGLPPGIAYDINSGELSGTPTEKGEFPVLFTATDTDASEVITLLHDFLVLPPTGGDAKQIPINFWVSKQKVKTGTGGSDSWGGSAIYNADRRTGSAFDPATETFSMSLGATSVQVDPGEFDGDAKSLSYKSPSDELPSSGVSLYAQKQMIKWSMKNATMSETVPGDLRHLIQIGAKRYRLLERFDEKGVFRPTAAYQRTAFVLAKGSLSALVAGEDKAKLGLLLADPSFFYEVGVSTLRVRILEGETVLLDRDFSALGTASIKIDSKTGATNYSIKTVRDDAISDTVKFSYGSGKGKMTLVLGAMTLGAISDAEAHLTFEITIGSRVYTTDVTFFEGKEGAYSTTAMPMAPAP